MAEDVFGLVGTVQAGTFRVEAAVAEGGFGVVYRAHHIAFRAPVALKCLKVPGMLSAEARQEFEEQFRAEAELLFQLSASTPTVVRPLQVGVADSPRAEFVPFMALEWLEGQSLDELISERREQGEPPLSLAETVQLLRPVAFALDNAHRFPGPDGAVCILHRDMKPDNVFIANVRGQQAVRILDFGIAKVKSAATAVVGKASAQASTLSAFTPGYGAPEQWVPKRFGQTGPWTDVYGFALTIVETIAGQPPIEGDHAAMMGAALDEQLRPTPRSCGVQLPEQVEAVFEQALAVDPRNRFKKMGAFWNALEAAVEGSLRPQEAATYQRRKNQAGLALSSLPPDPHGATRVVPRAADPVVPPPAAIPDLEASLPPSQPREEQKPAAGAASSGLTISAIDEFDDVEIQRGGAPGSEVANTAREPALPLELDGVGLSAGSRVAPPAGAVRMPRRQVARAHPVRAHGPPLGERMRTPLMLILLGSAVAGGGWVYQTVTGEVLTLGPVRPLFVAGPLVLIGLVMAVTRLFGAAD